MSTKTSPRRVAIRQRQTLKSLGYDDREIQAFARIFQPAAEQADPRFTCAADEEDQR